MGSPSKRNPDRRGLLSTAHSQLTRKGMAPAKSKWESRRKVRLLEKMRQFREVGKELREAYAATVVSQKANDVFRFLKREFPDAHITQREASIVERMYSAVRDEYQLRYGRRSKPYTFEVFLEDYVRVRKHRRSDESSVGWIFYYILLSHGLTGSLNETRSGSMLEQVTPNADYVHTSDISSFFERARRESSLHRTVIQQKGINLFLKLAFFRSLRFDVEDGVRKIESRFTPGEWARAASHIAGFAQKPSAVQDRILQEKRVNRFADEFADHFLRFARTYLDRKPESYEWLEQSLKRPGNRKFLAQKAIEMLKQSQR